jgi:hypothetical protein
VAGLGGVLGEGRSGVVGSPMACGGLAEFRRAYGGVRDSSWLVAVGGIGPITQRSGSAWQRWWRRCVVQVGGGGSHWRRDMVVGLRGSDLGLMGFDYSRLWKLQI